MNAGTFPILTLRCSILTPEFFCRLFLGKKHDNLCSLIPKPSTCGGDLIEPNNLCNIRVFPMVFEILMKI